MLCKNDHGGKARRSDHVIFVFGAAVLCTGHLTLSTLVHLQRPMSPSPNANIHDAVIEGNITAIQKLVREGISLETPDKVYLPSCCLCTS